MTEFKAPWGKMLWIMTGLSFSALVLLPLGLYYFQFRPVGAQPLALLIMPLLFFGAALFSVRGYVLEPNRLLVKRLLWTTAVDCTGCKSIYHDPEATSGSIRTFGNGGLFAFTGNFRNKKLGSYRAYLTDHKKAVVLILPKRSLVVSPHDPQSFEQAFRQFVPQQ